MYISWASTYAWYVPDIFQVPDVVRASESGQADSEFRARPLRLAASPWTHWHETHWQQSRFHQVLSSRFATTVITEQLGYDSVAVAA